MKEEISIHLLAKFNKAVIDYFSKADKFKTTENFLAWLDDLDKKDFTLRQDYERIGFEECQNMIPFMRFVLESNNIGFYQHMRNSLSDEDYKKFITPRSDLFVPNEMNIINLKNQRKLI